MSVDTKLYLNAAVNIEDVQAAITNYPLTVAYPIKNESMIKGAPKKRLVKTEYVPSSAVPGCAYVQFRLNNGTDETSRRSMWVVFNSRTPIGPCLYLKLACNDEAKKLFKYLAQIFGGFYMATDTTSVLEEVEGNMDGNNATGFYFNQAALKGTIKMDTKFDACMDAAKAERDAYELAIKRVRP